MNRTKVALAVGLGLVALLVMAPVANAKQAKHEKGPLPDLVVAKISKPPASETVGTQLNVIVKVRNKGGADAGKSRLGLYLAKKSKGKKHQAKGRRLKRAKVKALDAGGKAKLKVKAILPSNSTAGTYLLVACSDDTHKLRETKERDNCHASKSFKLAARKAPAPPAAPGAARPAFTTTDNLDWDFTEDAERNEPGPGEAITATLRAGNGIAGQAGYAQSAVAGEALLSGSTTTFNFGTETDDGAAAAELPFDFPFGGIKERAVSVSTNGWIEFGGSPAMDYWEDDQTNDYRGVNAVVGNFERGIMPYWGDLDVSDQGKGTGTVKMVVPAGGGSVAFQWDLSQHSGGGVPRRVVQLVLFPDGRFRFDYPGENASGGNEAFIGYSLGTGEASVNPIAVSTKAVLPGSLLFTPNAVSAGPQSTGQATLTLPAGSSFISGDPGCSATIVPGFVTGGLVSCSMPGLAAGEQATRTVRFAMPPKAPGQTKPANFRYLGSYVAGGSTLTDGDEINPLSSGLEAATLALNLEYIAGTTQVGIPASFKAAISGGPFDEPQATFTLPANAAFDSVAIEGKAIPCTEPSGGQVTCHFPSGASSTEPIVTVTPTVSGSKMKLVVSAQALNAPEITKEVESPVVAP